MVNKLPALQSRRNLVVPFRRWINVASNPTVSMSFSGMGKSRHIGSLRSTVTSSSITTTTTTITTTYELPLDALFRSMIPRYNATNTLTGDVFYWKPCNDFTLYNIFAGGIQYLVSAGFAFSMGTHMLAFSDAKDGYARFNMNGGNLGRNTYVSCACGSGNVLQFESEDPPFTFNFIFTSNACCPISESSSTASPTSSTASNITSDSSRSISTGAVMIIIFVVLLVACLVLGTIFYAYVKSALEQERIPIVLP